MLQDEAKYLYICGDSPACSVFAAPINSLLLTTRVAERPPERVDMQIFLHKQVGRNLDNMHVEPMTGSGRMHEQRSCRPMLLRRVFDPGVHSLTLICLYGVRQHEYLALIKNS